MTDKTLGEFGVHEFIMGLIMTVNACSNIFMLLAMAF